MAGVSFTFVFMTFTEQRKNLLHSSEGGIFPLGSSELIKSVSFLSCLKGIIRLCY